jgi:hypothetical protein
VPNNATVAYNPSKYNPSNVTLSDPATHVRNSSSHNDTDSTCQLWVQRPCADVFRWDLRSALLDTAAMVIDNTLYHDATDGSHASTTLGSTINTMGTSVLVRSTK